jgi:hypothetical protein
VETAVMIRGRARRKTMKRPRLNPIVSPLPKENEENTGQAMVINDARSPSVESKAAQRWKASATRQTHRSPPPACALADSDLTGRLRGRGELGGLRKARCGNNSGNSGDDPRVSAPQNDETPSS